jgi:hypothetical protein
LVLYNALIICWAPRLRLPGWWHGRCLAYVRVQGEVICELLKLRAVLCMEQTRQATEHLSKLKGRVTDEVLKLDK